MIYPCPRTWLDTYHLPVSGEREGPYLQFMSPPESSTLIMGQTQPTDKMDLADLCLGFWGFSPGLRSWYQVLSKVNSAW